MIALLGSLGPPVFRLCCDAILDRSDGVVVLGEVEVLEVRTELLYPAITALKQASTLPYSKDI